MKELKNSGTEILLLADTNLYQKNWYATSTSQQQKEHFGRCIFDYKSSSWIVCAAKICPVKESCW